MTIRLIFKIKNVGVADLILEEIGVQLTLACLGVGPTPRMPRISLPCFHLKCIYTNNDILVERRSDNVNAIGPKTDGENISRKI